MTFLDVHAIQSVPYSCLNRDGMGIPKSAVFGGVMRTRVSSQSWKRATRHDVEAAVNEPTFRSRNAALDIHNVLVDVHGWDPEMAIFAGRKTLETAGYGINSPKKTGKDGGDEEQPYTTKVLLWYPARTIDELASLCVSHREAISGAFTASQRKTARRKAKGDTDLTLDTVDPALDAGVEAVGDPAQLLLDESIANAADDPKGELLPKDEIQKILANDSKSINLFGRFAAEEPGANVDGAVAVQHAFTTHQGAEEMDWFTAVDDRRTRGTGHLDTSAFASGTFYRYATVDVDDLARNLRGTTEEAVDLALVFAQHFLTSMPSGKQHATAAYSLPELIFFSVRGDRPVSYDGAFEGPVRAGENGGYVEPSCTALANYVGNTARLMEGLTTQGPLFNGHVCLTPRAAMAQSLGEDYGSLRGLLTASRTALTDAMGER